MKKFSVFAFVMISMLLGACSKDAAQDPSAEIQSSQEYTVSLGMVGEIEMSTSPLTKADENTDLYGVQVYSKVDSDNSYYSACAYGLFDDLSAMTIKLLDGYLYKFVVTMVVDGKNVIRSSSSSYYAPFYAGGFTSIGNTFIWDGGSNVMGWIGSGFSYLSSDNSSYSYPFTDRYYGEATDYKPSEGGSVSIDMKRTVFGVKYIAEDLTEGKLLVNMSSAPLVTLTPETPEYEEIVTFYEVWSAWSTGDYSKNISVMVSWVKDDGATILLADETLTFTRIQQHTITIKVADNSLSNGVNISQESGGIVDGNSTTIDSGNNNDTSVNLN